MHRVDLDAKTCTREATVETCRHRRIALIRRRKQLAEMEQRYRHELMLVEEQAELWDLILRLRRRFYR